MPLTDTPFALQTPIRYRIPDFGLTFASCGIPLYTNHVDWIPDPALPAIAILAPATYDFQHVILSPGPKCTYATSERQIELRDSAGAAWFLVLYETHFIEDPPPATAPEPVEYGKRRL